MGNYLIDVMTWSYSRIGCFLQCPYQFYLKYINNEDEAPMFFSEYGSLIHDILAKYYSGKIPKESLLTEYLCRFPFEAVGAYPSNSIRSSYFQNGIECMKRPTQIEGDILGVEERVQFEIGDKRFIGFVDLIYQDNDGALCILDHKSRALKPRSGRKNPTKTDLELDDYLRQLYLYSIPISKLYGRYPDFLEFNCYRTDVRIKEPFQMEVLDHTKKWALDTIDTIRNEESWKPNIDFWRCKYLCPFHDSCEYAEMATE